MPRVRLQTLLLIVVLIAIWFATGRVDPELGSSLRTWCRAMVFVVSVLGALLLTAKKRAFWVGMVAMLIVCSVPPGWLISKYSPEFYHAHIIARSMSDNGSDQKIYRFTYDSIDLVSTLFLGLIASLVAIAFHSESACETSETEIREHRPKAK